MSNIPSILPKAASEEMGAKAKEFLLALCKIAEKYDLDDEAVAVAGVMGCQKMLIKYFEKKKEELNEQESRNHD